MMTCLCCRNKLNWPPLSAILLILSCNQTPVPCSWRMWVGWFSAACKLCFLFLESIHLVIDFLFFHVSYYHGFSSHCGFLPFVVLFLGIPLLCIQDTSSHSVATKNEFGCLHVTMGHCLAKVQVCLPFQHFLHGVKKFPFICHLFSSLKASLLTMFIASWAVGLYSAFPFHVFPCSDFLDLKAKWATHCEQLLFTWCLVLRPC